MAFGVYGLLLVMYAAQCALYRSSFPHNSRYDFPAMLLVPLTCCILACEVWRQLRPFYPERTMDHAGLAAAGFLAFALAIANLGKGPDLVVAVRKNIDVTTAFSGELQRIVLAARENPKRPIILEAYQAGAYEPVFSFQSYLAAYGVQNVVSVRLHLDDRSHGALYDGLRRLLVQMQDTGGRGLVPLRDNLAGGSQGCISIEIDGAPDANCAGFEVNIR